MVNKIELLSYLDFKLECFYINPRDVNPDVEVIELSVQRVRARPLMSMASSK